MSKRRFVYPGQIPRDLDFLEIQKNWLKAFGSLVKDLFFSNPIPAQLSVVPFLAGFETVTYPGGMQITFGDGRAYVLSEADATAFAAAGIDTTMVILQAEHDGTTLTFGAAPTTAGQSRIDLVQAVLAVVDENSVVLEYYNSSNPAQPFTGPNDNNIADYQDRTIKVVLSIKVGTPGTSPVAPSPDVNNLALYPVTIHYGDTILGSGNLGAAYAANFYNGVATLNATTIPMSGTDTTPIATAIATRNVVNYTDVASMAAVSGAAITAHASVDGFGLYKSVTGTAYNADGRFVVNGVGVQWIAVSLGQQLVGDMLP